MQSLTAPPTVAPAPCPFCGAVGSLQPMTREITDRKRRKLGLFWLLVSLTGIGFLVWLVLPRKKVVISVDRYVRCTKCHKEMR